MKIFCKIAILLLGLQIFCTKAVAQDVVRSHIPLSTNVSEGRFEFLRSTKSPDLSFLLDKYSGKVWRRTGRRTLERIPVEGLVVEGADKINFQLYMGNSNVSDCFLLNIHTGELWEYYVERLTNRAFRKLEMPVELKLEE